MHTTTLIIKTKFSYRCRVTCPQNDYQLPYISNKGKTLGGHSVLFWYFLPFCITSKAWTAITMSTATWHTEISLSRSTAMLAYTSVFNLPLLHFHYNFLRSTLFEPANSISLHHFFLCLQSPCHHTANTKPTNCNPMPTARHLTSFKGKEYCGSLGTQTHQWQFLHTLLYQNRNHQLYGGSVTNKLRTKLEEFFLCLKHQLQTFRQNSFINQGSYYKLCLQPTACNLWQCPKTLCQ